MGSRASSATRRTSSPASATTWCCWTRIRRAKTASGGWRKCASDAQAPPVILIADHGDTHVAIQAMKAGAADFLRKTGLTAQRLTRAIEDALREQEARHLESTGTRSAFARTDAARPAAHRRAGARRRGRDPRIPDAAHDRRGRHGAGLPCRAHPRRHAAGAQGARPGPAPRRHLPAALRARVQADRRDRERARGAHLRPGLLRASSPTSRWNTSRAAPSPRASTKA